MHNFTVGQKVVFKSEQARDSFFCHYGNRPFSGLAVLTVESTKNGRITGFEGASVYITESESSYFEPAKAAVLSGKLTNVVFTKTPVDATTLEASVNDYVLVEGVDLQNLPRKARGAKFGCCPDGLKWTFSDGDWFYTNCLDLTLYTHAYVFEDGLYKEVLNFKFVEEEILKVNTPQLEIGTYFRMEHPNGANSDDFPTDSIVKLIKQEDESYEDNLPYKVQLINSTQEGWVHRKTVLVKL